MNILFVADVSIQDDLSGAERVFWLIVSFLKYVSGGRWLLGFSLEVTAMK